MSLFLLLIFILLLNKLKSETVTCPAGGSCQCINKDELCRLECPNWHSCYTGTVGTTLSCNANYPCEVECGSAGGTQSCTAAIINSNGASSLTVNCEQWEDCKQTQINCQTNGGTPGICNVICSTSESSVDSICRDLTLHCGTSRCSITCGDNTKACLGITVTTTSAYSFQCIGTTTQCSDAPPEVLPPTSNPTTDPSTSPTTAYPTIPPTTAAPTIEPTINPTIDPTNDPTNNPTTEPTIDPTIDPTGDPTIDPTIDPTTDPTNDPTSDPTIDPTIDPTNDPTNNPTTEPTIDPTSDPTSDPTTDPTMEPTTDPTIDPSIDPTIDPTIDPSIDPTKHPSISPTAKFNVVSNITLEIVIKDDTDITPDNIVNLIDDATKDYLNTLFVDTDYELTVDVVKTEGDTLFVNIVVATNGDVINFDDDELIDENEKEIKDVYGDDVIINDTSNASDNESLYAQLIKHWYILVGCIVLLIIIIALLLCCYCRKLKKSKMDKQYHEEGIELHLTNTSAPNAMLATATPTAGAEPDSNNNTNSTNLNANTADSNGGESDTAENLYYDDEQNCDVVTRGMMENEANVQIQEAEDSDNDRLYGKGHTTNGGDQEANVTMGGLPDIPNENVDDDQEDEYDDMYRNDNDNDNDNLNEKESDSDTDKGNVTTKNDDDL